MALPILILVLFVCFLIWSSSNLMIISALGPHVDSYKTMTDWERFQYALRYGFSHDGLTIWWIISLLGVLVPIFFLVRRVKNRKAIPFES